ncbi:uncharacterized protein LOC144701262 isoform X2 [Wolffia australiana]
MMDVSRDEFCPVSSIVLVRDDPEVYSQLAMSIGKRRRGAMLCWSSSSSESKEEGRDVYGTGGYHAVHPGDKFTAGRYVAQRKLGRGHFSTIWLAYDLRMSIRSLWKSNSPAVIREVDDSQEIDNVFYVVGVLRSANPATCLAECLSKILLQNQQIVRDATTIFTIYVGV